MGPKDIFTGEIERAQTRHIHINPDSAMLEQKLVAKQIGERCPETVVAHAGFGIRFCFGKNCIARDDLFRIMQPYAAWELWAWVVLMGVAQAVFLVVPVRFASRRPVSRRTLLAPILTSGLMAALLAAGLAYSISEFELAGGSGSKWGWIPFALGGGVWLAWAAYFWRFSAAQAPQDAVKEQAKALLKGSILELLVAVPTHVVARWRDYCCAGLMTFVGIACGIAVMLFAFGPGVFFLYVERWRRLHPDAAKAP